MGVDLWNQSKPHEVTLLGSVISINKGRKWNHMIVDLHLKPDACCIEVVALLTQNQILGAEKIPPIS